MQKFTLALVLIMEMAFAACGVCVKVDGKKIKEKPKKMVDDSILVFGMGDLLPDSAVLLSNTKLYVKGLWCEGESPSFYYTMLPYAKNEVYRQGGNLIKLVNKEDTRMSGYVLSIQVYLLDEPWLAQYKLQYASAERERRIADENAAVVHIMIRVYRGRRCPVFFNDSLVGYVHRSVHKKQIISKIDFRFLHSGVLRLGRKAGAGEPVVPGQEYYLLIRNHRATYYFDPIQRFEFNRGEIDY